MTAEKKARIVITNVEKCGRQGGMNRAVKGVRTFRGHAKM